MNRPSVLNLGPDASDVTEEVDYIHPKRKARITRASEHAIETTGQMHRITRMASVTEDSIPNTMNPIVNPTMNPTMNPIVNPIVSLNENREHSLV